MNGLRYWMKPREKSDGREIETWKLPSWKALILKGVEWKSLKVSQLVEVRRSMFERCLRNIPQSLGTFDRWKCFVLLMSQRINSLSNNNVGRVGSVRKAGMKRWNETVDMRNDGMRRMKRTRRERWVKRQCTYAVSLMTYADDDTDGGPANRSYLFIELPLLWELRAARNSLHRTLPTTVSAC